MVAKRKTNVRKFIGAFAKNSHKIATKAALGADKLKQKRGEKECDVESEYQTEDAVESTSTIMKKPAFAKNQEVEVEETREDEEGGDEDQEEETNDETSEPTEADIIAGRTKELKGKSAMDLKSLALSLGLDTGTKDAMIKGVLRIEATQRKEAVAHRSKILEVVKQKREEFDAWPVPKLTKACKDLGFKELHSKPAKIERLMRHWQEKDGIDQAFALLAIQERKEKLNAMDNDQLKKLCNKLGLDAYIKEVMAERVSRKEHEVGLYSRPSIKEVASAPKEGQGADMIEVLLASEAQRKKERDLRVKREEAMVSKRKGLNALSLNDLNKQAAKKGLTAGKTKDEVITTLLLASVQEDLAEERKSSLLSKSTQDVIDLLDLNGLDSTGGKDKMVKRFLEHESKVNEELKAFEIKVATVIEMRRTELERESNTKLKELCSNQGLATGGDRSERVDRLVEEERKQGVFDASVSRELRAKRLDALVSMTKPALLQICQDLDVDPFVKDVMVERVMAYEKENPSSEQSEAKRARTSK